MKKMPTHHDIRIHTSGDAQWRRINHVAWTTDSPLEDEVYLELTSSPHCPVIVDLVAQQIRLLVFPGKFEVMKLRDEDVVGPK